MGQAFRDAGEIGNVIVNRRYPLSNTLFHNMHVTSKMHDGAGAWAPAPFLLANREGYSCRKALPGSDPALAKARPPTVTSAISMATTVAAMK